MSMALENKDLRIIFSDNMEKAICRCKSLHKVTGSKHWESIVVSLSGLKYYGELHATKRKLSAKEISEGMDRQVKRINARKR
jgi:hypothetical protein